MITPNHLRSFKILLGIYGIKPPSKATFFACFHWLKSFRGSLCPGCCFFCCMCLQRRQAQKWQFLMPRSSMKWMKWCGKADPFLDWKSTSLTNLVFLDSDNESCMEVRVSFVISTRYILHWNCNLWFWIFGHLWNMKMPSSFLHACRMRSNKLWKCSNDHKTRTQEISRDSDGWTALHFAAEAGNPSYIL